MTAPAPTKPLPPGAVRWSTTPYRDTTGKYVTPASPVPVDATGRPVTAPAIPPVPWRRVGHRLRHHWRPWAIMAATAGTGALADTTGYPAAWVAGIPAAAASAWWAAPRLIRGTTGGDTGRAAEREGRRRRHITWCAATASAWVAGAATFGLDPTTLAGRSLWTVLVPAGAALAWPYWRHHPNAVQIRHAPAVTAGDSIHDLVVQEIQRRWAEGPAWAGGNHPTGTVVKAGKFAGATLEDLRPVEGGWGARIVLADGSDLDWAKPEPARLVARAYRVGVSSVEIDPDPADASAADLLVQRTDPLENPIPWAGPDSIDIATGRALLGKHKDGSPLYWEMYRPGWGVSHEGIFGTTGSGKSELLSLLMLIERWMACPGPDGVMRPMAVTLLHDPQDGMSYPDFADNVAVLTTSTDEATMIADALLREAERRQKYLRGVRWYDARRDRWRTGRKHWDPLIDGPTLNWSIDEAHVPLSDKAFVAALLSGARMFRKVGIKIRVCTHTPMLEDLKSLALRDMILSGQVWVGRTANSLSGPTAFNGRLASDPKLLPEIPGINFALPAGGGRGAKARAAYEPDYLDYILDHDDQPVGYPGQLPPETIAAFGADFAAWRAAGGLWAPLPVPAEQEMDNPAVAASAEEAVAAVLLAADQPLDIAAIDAALGPFRDRGGKCSTRTARAVLAKLCDAELACKPTGHKHYELTELGRERYAA